MKSSAKKIYELLENYGGDTIYHANSVITSCHYLRSGFLLSRGKVEEMGLYQTPQQSDKKDKEYGIWFDVFADTADIHYQASDANVYGPVLFRINSEVLINECIGEVRVTKLNPVKWEDKQEQDRWYLLEKDLEDNFARNQFDQIIVIINPVDGLRIKEYLREIIIDNPKLKPHGSNIDYFDRAHDAVKKAMKDGGIDVNVSKRECLYNCRCIDRYKRSPKNTELMFSSEITD